MTKKVDRWYHPGKSLATRDGEYHITDSETKRRRIALKSRNGDLLATARALGQGASVNKGRNRKAYRIMKSDADYFYGRYDKSKK